LKRAQGSLARIVGIIAIVAAFAITLSGASAQESLNELYRFPFSAGAAYVPMSAVGGAERRAAVNDFQGEARVPMPFAPAFQPFLLIGMESYDSDEAVQPSILDGGLADGATMPDYDERDVWDHRKFYGGLGAGYAHRIRKEFEVGADAYAALSQSYFERRVVTAAGEWYPVGSLGLAGGVTGKLTLNPSFNVSVDILPSFRYHRSLGALRDFDGFYFGLGLSASYRFGLDPDGPGTEVRAIRFGEIEMPPVFASMQSVYVNEPVTTVTITNTESQPLTDVQVTFHQPGFMDSSTQSAQLAELGPGESARVPIHASFNREVFFTNGVTPLNGEVAVSYTYRRRPVRQTQSVTYDLHDRNAMTWDDDRKVCAYITPSDSAIGNYASFIRSSARDETTGYLPESLEYAMQVYHALAALGILYQPDPSSPFTEVQGNTLLVDSVSLPRETLVDITGDCDDITVLFNTLLETTGVRSGIVTIPGHIYSAIDTGLSPREFATVHPDRDMTLEIDGTLWIFVEITLIGQTGFIEAWRTGMDQWRQYNEDVAKRSFYPTGEAQAAYRPVGLQETDLGLQYGEPEEFIRPFRTDRNRLAGVILQPLRERATSRRRARDWNRLGIAAARLKQHRLAEDALERAAALDRDDVSPQVNLGSLRFLQGDYPGALAAFRDAERAVSRGSGSARRRTELIVSINLAKTLYELERFDEATAYVEQAEEIDPEEAARYRFIAAATGEGGARASAPNVPDILFLDGDEEADEE